MRKLFLIGGAAALIAVPGVALADSGEQAPETDPTAEAGPGTTTDKALHAEGKGAYVYEGSGGVTIDAAGIVRVKDLSDAKDLVTAADGWEATTTAEGRPTRYRGDGTLTLDGSSFRVTILGRFTSDVDPTATHLATGWARVAGRGATILDGGVPVPFWASQRILLTHGPTMSVDLSGRGGREWIPVVKIHKGKGHHAVRAARRAIRATSRGHGGWRWFHRAAGATWRVGGPAFGTVELATITGRVRVWDLSDATDPVVAVPAGTTTTTLKDGSIVYSGLKAAKVTVSGSGFRMKVRAWDVEGVFTPTPGTLARSFVRGKGTFDTGDQTDVRPGRHGGVRVLLQAAPAKAA